MKGKKVMVAGGAGFIGSQLVRELLDEGAEVSVFDNFLHGDPANLTEVKNDVELVIGDLLDEWKLLGALQRIKPQYIYDLVGDTYVPTAYDIPKRFFRINVEGTMNLLLAAQVAGTERILYVSSTEVYGEAISSEPMTEDHPLNPYNTYAVSKTAADRLCFTFHKERGIPVVLARIFNSYGARESEPYVIPEIIAQLSKGKVLRLGNIKARRDFTYVSDTSRGLMTIMESDVPNGDHVHVGSQITYSIEELVSMIAKIMDVPDYEIVIDPARFRKLDIEMFYCNNSRLKSLGWKPLVGIEEGLRKTVEWYISHGSRWSWEDWTDGTILYDAKM